MYEIIQNSITDFITTRREMVLSAAENELECSCKVRYISPDGRNLYFLIRTAVRHCQIITNYPQATAVIFEPVGAYDAKKGVRLTGKVEKVCDPDELIKVAAWYSTAFPSSEKMITTLLPGMTGLGAPSAFYRVAVESVKTLNIEITFSQPDFAAA